MSFHALQVTLNATFPSREARDVAIVLADYADGEGKCWPCIATIARKAMLSERTAVYALRALEACRFLTIARGAGSHPSIYRSACMACPDVPVKTPPWIAKRGAPHAPPKVEGVHLMHQVVHDVHPEVAQEVHHKKTLLEEEPISTSLRSVTRAREGDGFADFYQAYPRKVGRGQAERAWRGALRAGAKPAAIISGLKAQLPTMREQDQRFVPYPATWLNGQRWLDEPPETTEQALDRMVAEMSRAAWEKQQRAPAQ